MASNKALIAIRVTSVLLVSFFAFFIFFMSAAEGEESTALSMQVAVFILETLERLGLVAIPDGEMTAWATGIQFYVRKAAHITEFAMLTFSVMGIFYSYRNLTKRTVLYSVLMAIAFAATDEYHQTFIPDRCGTPVDVMVDSIGIVGAALVVCLISRIRRSKC